MSKTAKFLVIAALPLGAALAFGYVSGGFSPHRLSPARMIQAFEQSGGSHPGFRRNHAKGLCVTGFFDSNGAGARLSKALVFAPGRIPVLGRLALAGSQPFQADAAHTVRSMALRFSLPDGEEWRTGMNAIPVFPLKTPQDFYDQLVASEPDAATQKPDPQRMAAFMQAHPDTARAVKIIGAQPVSSGFADSTYNGLDAFRFVAATGVAVPVRWSMVPSQAFLAADSPAVGTRGPNYLFDAVIAGLQQAPLQWHLIVTIGQAGDPANDASQAWPAGREHVDVGTLTIDHAQGEDGGGCTDINYDPLVLPSGIEASDDPLLSARSAAYSRSFTLRAGEKKPPSAVQTPGMSAGDRP